MNQVSTETVVPVVPLELGGALRILSEDVDLVRGTVRWQVRGPHITGVVWLTREDSWDVSDDPDDPANYRCRLYSGDSTGERDRGNDVIRTDPLTCYGVPASRYRLGERMAHLADLAGDEIPEPNVYAVTASARRVVDVRHTLTRHALAAHWLPDLLWTWRLQTAVKIAARATADRVKALNAIRAARSTIRCAQAVLNEVGAENAEAAARGIAPLARDGFDLHGPAKPTDPANTAAA